MKKFTDFIINKRYFILVLFIILTIVSGFFATKVKINHDISKYLPDTSETRIGMNIMEEEFSDSETSTLNLMFENLPNEKKQEIKSELESVNNVKSVDYDESDNYNKDIYTLYVITVDDVSDSSKASSVYNDVSEKFKDYTYIEVNIETGRTHQIRVHMSKIGFPIIGDYVYSSGKNEFGVERTNAS